MDYTEIFDRYLDGRLSEESRKDFEKDLSNNPDLASQFARYKQLHGLSEKAIGGESDKPEDVQIDAETDDRSRADIDEYRKKKNLIPDKELADFEKSLKKAEKEVTGKQHSVRITRRIIWYTAAAIVAGAILILSIFFAGFGSKEPEKIYMTYFESYKKSEKIFELTRSSDDFYFVMKVFESGDFTRALLLFEQYADSADYAVYATFYAGITNMNMERWTEAIESFIQVIEKGESEMMVPARWYLGLCYLKIDDTKSARKQFEQLSRTKNQYTSRARRILRRMK